MPFGYFFAKKRPNICIYRRKAVLLYPKSVSSIWERGQLLDLKQEDIFSSRHIPLLTSGETLSGKKKYVPSPLYGCVGHYHKFAALLVAPQSHAFIQKP
jgi:hypothetical protein